MKQQSKAQRRKQRPAHNLVPSFEECLTFLMDNLSHSRDGLKTSTLSAKEKQRFRQMECKADALALDDYRDILRRILAPGLHDLTAESKAHVEVLLEERTQFLKRYEALNSQVVPGNAKRHEVLWVLSHRFFLPWLALRLAYRLPDDTDIGATAEDCWFLPLHGDGFGSCVMKVIDRFVREKDESNAELARRLYHHLPKDERDRLAIPFEGDLSKYSQRTTTPSDATIGLLVRGTDAVPHLRLMLVLARFIDRCVRDARKVFGDGLALELLDYFVLCFVHFRGVLKQVRAEVSASPHDKVQEFRFNSTGEGVPIIPATEAERVWLRLNSPTDMGNTPGQWARFLPLMDMHMVELARRINTELHQTVRSKELSFVPRDYDELNDGHYPFRIPTAIPEAIEKAPLHGSVRAAVEASQRIFCGHVNLAAAITAKQRFEFLGLGTFVVTADGRPGFCSPEDAALAELECNRLFQLIYEQAPERHRPRLALQLLKYLIEPSRPKTTADRKLARALFKVVSKPMRQRKQRGALLYFTGCLHALDSEHKKALKAFTEARKLGRESCGKFWVDLLRAGMLMADSVGAKQEQKNFAKRAGMIGLFTNDATPRTNEMKAQMRAEHYLRAAAAAFKPFPAK
jgi:hypothetical protein